MLAALHALFVFFLPGALIVAVGRRNRPGRIEALRAVLMAIWTSVVLTTGVTHALGIVGGFTPRRAFVLVAGVVAVMLIVAVRSDAPVFRWRWSWRLPLALTLAVGFVWISLPGAERLDGSADEGVYLNTAVHLAETGQLHFKDPILDGLPPSLRQYHAPFYGNGFYFTAPAERGAIVPHGFHFFPAFLAMLYAIGGLDWALAGPSLLMALSLCSFVLLAARFTGPTMTTLATLAIAVSPWALYFGRVTFAESMSAALLAAAAALLATSTESAHGRGATGCPGRDIGMFVAGALLGAMHLVKVDFWALPPILVVSAIVWHAAGRRRRAASTLAAGYGLLLAAAIGQALTTHGIYFDGQVRYAYAKIPGLRDVAEAARLGGGAGIVGIGVAALGGLAITTFALRRVLARVLIRLRDHDRLGRVAMWTAGALGGAAAIVSFLPAGDLATHENWSFLARLTEVVRVGRHHLTIPVLVIGAAGVVLWSRRRDAGALVPIVLIVAAQAGFAFALAGSTDWGMAPLPGARRFLNGFFPLLTLAALLPWSWAARRSLRIGGVVLATIVIGLHASATIPLLDVKPAAGMRAAVERVATSAPGDVVWFASSRDDAAKAMLVPLRFLERQPTFVYHDHGDEAGFSAVLSSLVAAGRTPTLLVSERYRQLSDRPPLGETFSFPAIRSSDAAPAIGRWRFTPGTARSVRVSILEVLPHFGRLPRKEDYETHRVGFLVAPAW